MAKKTDKKTKAKAKAKKSEQLKIAGTERTNAIPEINDADVAYREARDARMELQEEESAAQDALTAILQKHALSEYTYEGPDGKLYKAYIGEPKAKSKRVTEKKIKAPDAE
jgi:hypothetical protein